MKRVGYSIYLVVVFCAMMVSVRAWADAPQVNVKVLLISVSGDTTLLVPGESSPVAQNVPLRAEFISELVSDTDDAAHYQLFPQWVVTRTYSDGETHSTEDYLKRQESITEYEFTDFGKFQIKYAWSYRGQDDVETILGEEVEPMEFTIDDSEIRLYNAFSPNGDGINDEYKIYVRSIATIKIAIFNRWGQTIKTISGPIDAVLPSSAEPDNDGGYLFEIWDGTFNGEIVNDGVYFINVQAVGAGGKRYEERSDINVLKGLGVLQ